MRNSVLLLLNYILANAYLITDLTLFWWKLNRSQSIMKNNSSQIHRAISGKFFSVCNASQSFKRKTDSLIHSLNHLFEYSMNISSSQHNKGQKFRQSAPNINNERISAKLHTSKHRSTRTQQIQKSISVYRGRNRKFIDTRLRVITIKDMLKKTEKKFGLF